MLRFLILTTNFHYNFVRQIKRIKSCDYLFIDETLVQFLRVAGFLLFIFLFYCSKNNRTVQIAFHSTLTIRYFCPSIKYKKISNTVKNHVLQKNIGITPSIMYIISHAYRVLISKHCHTLLPCKI